jgi:hypothetical protein
VTTITATKIPNDSYEIRIFHGDDVPGESDIETVLVLRNEGDGVCEVSLAHGHLYNESIILVGLKAMELGFKYLNFHALKGKSVTRWAEPVSNDDKFDYYTVDLDAAAAIYLSGKSL